MTEKRTEFTYLGRILGTGTGWDGEGDIWCIYDFEPAVGIHLQKCDSLNINQTTGLFEIYTPEGALQETFDIIDYLKDAPRAPKPIV